MEKMTDRKEYYEKKAAECYQESEKAQKEYQDLLNRCDEKVEKGNPLTKDDVIAIANQMKNLHDSMEVFDQGLEYEKKAMELK